MKSYQFLYSNKYKFIDQLTQIKNEYINESNNIFFYLTWANQERQVLDEVTELLSDYFPEAFYYGSESAGNIINGGLEFGIAVCCYVLEEKQSRIKPIWVEQGTEYESLDKLWEFCRNEKGIRAVELAPSLSYLGELRIDNNIPNIGDDICIFGGVSVCMDSMNMGAKILAKGHGVVEDGMIAVIYYGDNLNFSSNYVLGWKGLGRYMTVTKSHNKVIEEIDSVPPFSIYEKYLDISREDSANIVFPLIIVEDDVEYIRTPQMILPDKTMRMFADIEEGVSARMAYGDKNTILKSLFEKATEVANFQPQILRAYSCIARRLFWGDDEINKETVPLQKIAPLGGYYTGGEILRIKDKIKVLNSTLVVISIREGEAATEKAEEEVAVEKKDNSLISRITHFVEVVSKEQEEALEIAYEEKLHNDMLHAIINSGKWSCTINEKDEIIEYDFAEGFIDYDVKDSIDKISLWINSIHPDDREDTIKEFNASIKDHSCKTTYDVTYRMLNKDGDYHWYHSAGRVIRDKNDMGEFFGIHIDITEQIEKHIKEQQMLEEALNMADSANHAKTEFLFNMSHDIRTPMNAILGFTNIAMKHIEDKEKVVDCLTKTAQSGELLLALINNVLEVSRIESGKASLNLEKCDLYYCFANIEDTMNVMAESKDISLMFEYKNITDRYVLCDISRCARVFVNIISNSIKYTNEGGYVKVICEQLGEAKDGIGTYQYTFEDNGIGMSDEFQKHVFEQFSREKSVTMTGIQGTGLGMAVCKSFVELMGGTIEVKSELGMGTVFTLILPFKICESVETIMEMNSSSDNMRKMFFSGKRVLLAEDNELNREIATDLLQDEGFEVDEVEDGTMAVEKLMEKGAEYYDLILMDIQMPVMGGYEATRRIREMYPEKKIPIIALSANAFEEDKAASVEAGMDDHVAKPINTELLFKVLKKFICE